MVFGEPAVRAAAASYFEQPGMKLAVELGRQETEVGEAVVVDHAVDVIDVLIRAQGAVEGVGHDEAVSVLPAAGVGVGMTAAEVDPDAASGVAGLFAVSGRSGIGLKEPGARRGARQLARDVVSWIWWIVISSGWLAFGVAGLTAARALI